MTIDHGSRDHAKWSASSTERNWQCPGALALTEGTPNRTSEAADWGTCAHQIAEHCLRKGTEAAEFIGTDISGKEFSFEVDEEMAETAQIYVDYVRKAAIHAAKDKHNPADLLTIESKFSLDDLDTPFEAGGTCDAIVYFPEEKTLEVIDLKGGRGHVVEVEGNPQLRTYALGAMLANAKMRVDYVRVTIVQPRAPHKSGRIRSETFHTADLVEWTTDLVAAMVRSAQALAFRGKVAEAAWAAAHLNAGDHCKFCPAAAFCPALETKALDAAHVWFDDEDRANITNRPDDMSPEKLAATLDSLDMIENWISAVRSYAHRQAEDGFDVPGYILVDKIGRRKWTLEGAALVAALESKGIDHQHLWVEPKVKSPAQIEKTIGAKNKSLINDLVETPVTGTNLVRADKTSRPAVKPGVGKFFDILE